MTKTYEVTAAGFDGGTDETDDRVYWISAESEEQVQEAIADTGAKFCGELRDRMGALDPPDDCIDFTLPRDALSFSSELLHWASEERNKNRVA